SRSQIIEIGIPYIATTSFRVHNTFHVSNLKKCHANEPLAVPLDGLHFDDILHFVEEPVEIMDREVKWLNVKINSRRKMRYVQPMSLSMLLVKQYDDPESGCESYVHATPSELPNSIPLTNNMPPKRTSVAVRVTAAVARVAAAAALMTAAVVEQLIEARVSSGPNGNDNNRGNSEITQNAGACYDCGVQGHFKKDCPKLKNKNCDNQGGNGNAPAKVYVVGNVRTNPDSNIVMGTFILNNRYTFIVFDTGADRSFISNAFSSLIDITPTTLDHYYDVELADRKIIGINAIIQGCTLNFLDHPFNIDVIPVELEKKRKLKFNAGNNHGYQQQNKRQNTRRTYTAGPGEKREYTGSLPMCTKCNYHHKGPCAPKCNKCKKIVHLAHDCRSSGPNGNDNNRGNSKITQNAGACYDCGVQGHFKRDCPKLKNKNCDNQGGNGNAPAKVYVVGNVRTNPDSNIVIDLMPVELGSFDSIIGMDWLAKYHAVIVCAEKIVRISWGNEILIVHGDRSDWGNETRL
nr:reverse transcriptase domain-containing protein [Tanacetum cinerariifolium]